MKKYFFFLVAFALASTITFAYQNVYGTYRSDYTGPFYTHSTTFDTGHGFGWDRTVVIDGYTSHSAGYVERGPYRCLGSGCGYWGRDYYSGWSSPYYNSKTYDHSYLLYDNYRCSGYWRGGCEYRW